jgi:signal transduction histidine kinase/DNA-binding NarL/FixJ family response regulator
MPQINVRARRTLRGATATVTWLGLAMIALIWGGIELDIRQERQFAHRAATQTAHNYARLFEEHIARSISEVDNTIKFIRQDFLREPGAFDLQSWVKNRYSLNDLTLQFTVIGADGIMLSTTTPGAGSRVDLSDREHFRVQVEAPADALFISKPVLGRASGRWSIQLTRRITDSEGRFAGVIVASVDPYRLSRFYESIDLGRSGSIAVVGRDRVVRARAGLSVDNLGISLDDPQLFERVHFNPVGMFDQVSPTGESTAVTAYRAIEDYPLILTVTVSDSDAAAGRLASEWKARLIAGGMSLVVLLVVALGIRHRRRLDNVIDELTLSRAEVAETSRELDLTLNNMSQGILMVDANENVAVINRRALELLDLPQTLMAERLSFRMLLEHQWRAGEFGAAGADIPEKLRQYVQSGGLSAELPVYERTRPNGMVLEVRSVPLAGGGIVRTYTDITERKEAERDLSEARDRAEAASQVRTSFLATMSHEIRTPLNGIIGMSSILEHTELNDEQQSYLRTIHGCGEALLEIINDVLDYSKLDSGTIELEDKDIRIKEIVSSTVDILGPRIAEKHLTLDLDYASDLPDVIHSDGSRIRQVLINLVGNSAKFTEKGGITIKVEKRSGLISSLPRLRFSVIDTGIGIADEARERLFKEFSQVDASITRRFGGTGLGLAICKRIVEAMQGQIEVESIAGKGSTFWFEIPVRVVTGEAARASAGIPAAVSALGAIHRELRILVVEDNKVNQEVATLLLKRIGHEVEIAENGQIAIDMANAKRFDLILMDMQMPVMGGIEATKAIRAGSGSSRSAPIIGLTANAFASDRQACLDAGMDGFLPKPVTRAKLTQYMTMVGSADAPAGHGAASDDNALINTDYRDMLFEEIGAEAGQALVQSFWRDGQAIMAELRAALAVSDRQKAETQLHTLKGAAANMGYEAITRAAGNHLTADGDKAALAALESAFERTQEIDDPAVALSRNAAAA